MKQDLYTLIADNYTYFPNVFFKIMRSPFQTLSTKIFERNV
jgi:hypothetical protein